MAIELHNEALADFNEPDVEIGEWYAVEYLKSFFFGKALLWENSCIEFKFLHAVWARIFDWPRRHDTDKCHKLCILYGPCVIITGEGGTFTFPQLGEIEQVQQYLKRSRKNN